MFPNKAIFFDRDGTLVKMIHRPDHPKPDTAPFALHEIVFEPNAYVALNMAREAGFLTKMLTNQPDVANGYLTYEDWLKVHTVICDTLGFDKRDVYMCRHRDETECDRKKPSPKMLFDARDNLGIDLSYSYVVGDTWKDMEAGLRAGCRRVIMINRRYNLNYDEGGIRVDSLLEAVKFIIQDEKDFAALKDDK